MKKYMEKGLCFLHGGKVASDCAVIGLLEKTERDRKVVTVVLGYSSRCRVCNSGHRDEIEKWMIEGKYTLEEAEEQTEKQFGVRVSRSSIWRHMREHFVTPEDVKKIYTERKAKQEPIPKEVKKVEVKKPEPEPEPEPVPEKDEFDLAFERSKLLRAQYVEHNLSELEKLDDMIENDYAMYRRTVELMAEKLETKMAPKPLVDFLRVLNNNINTSLKTKAELLGTDAEGRKASVMETWIDIIGSLD